ncbi:apoptosis regulator [Rhodotorula toruloides]|uniref:Apoptosis regulator n=1 Tax=Rhodotorula toruloides TaxID=5286 RepID=A0A511KF95_RHOTO|nr:apoptosis regulator [Rhodotorula toruloides]
MFPAYGTSNPWRSRSQPPPPRRNRKPHLSRQADEALSQQARPQAAQKPAEGPADERTQHLQQLDGIKRRFEELSSKFSPPLPPSLTFQPSASSNAPKLEYTSTNAPVHGYEDALTKLLMELDGVESGGDLEVRTRRKELVRNVESEAQRVEKWRRECFEARQKGEEGPEWVKGAEQGKGAKEEERGTGDEEDDAQDGTKIFTSDGDEERGDSVVGDGEEADEVSTVTTASLSRPSTTPQTPSSADTGSTTDEAARPPGLSIPSAEEKEHMHDALEAAAAEDGDEDEDEGAFAAAVEEEDDEEEPRQILLRGRLSSAPASNRPHVATPSQWQSPGHPQRQHQPDVHIRPPFAIHPQRLEPQQQPHRQVEPERRYVDPLEALLGIPSRRVAEQRPPADLLFRRRSPQRYVPATYADDVDDEMDYSPFHAYTPQAQRPVYRSPPQHQRQIPYAGYSTPSSLFGVDGGGGVPWYAHGYPHERDLYEYAQRQQQQQAQQRRAGYGTYGGGFGGGPFGFGGMW